MNKRLISMLLALAMLLGTMPAALAESVESVEPAALPEIGDVVEGFEVMETRDYPLVDAVIYRFEHQKTGAQLFYIANDDTNRAFDLTFFTEAIDNTGLPHVFEHATIQGSKKYPGEQMFFNLSYQTYNTFLNAMTSQWYTSYPIASLSEAQLLKLAEFYVDGCFYPIIMENEHIFRTEAWRYRLASADDPLTIEGTVYSEMLGATNLVRGATTNLHRAAFPGSMVGNVPGGDPDFIPDMTWESLKDYHDLYYHPSNSAAFLYGRFDDYTAFLKLLDSYYSQYEKREFHFREDAGYTPIAEPVVQSLSFPMEAGSSVEHNSYTYYAFVCPGLRDSLQDELVLDTMTDLFTANASSLQQRLQEAIPYGSFGAYIDMSGPDDAIVFIANSIDPEDVDAFRTIVDEELADVAANGFPQDLVDSVAASMAISALLTRESSDPVNNILTPMIGRYVETGNPWDLMDYQDGLFSINDWNARGLYAQAVSDWLLDSRTTALITTYPEPGAKEAHDAALADRLAEVKANMSDEEIAALMEATNAEAPEDHSDEYVATLKAVTVESLPEEIQRYDVTDGTDEAGVRHIEALAAVDGVSEPKIYLDAAGIAQEDIHWFMLYTNLMGNLDTTAHTKAELANLSSRYLYQGSITPSLPLEGANGYHPYMRIDWIALDDDLAAGYDLVRELVFDTKVDDPAKLLEQVQSIRSSVKNEINNNPASTLLSRALARTSERYAYKCCLGGVSYYEFLDEVERLLAEDPDAAVQKLKDIQASFNNRSGAVAMCAGNAASIALNRQLSDAFLASLDEREIVPAEYDFPIPEAREALVIESGVQFNLLAGDLAAVGLDGFDGSLTAVNKLVTDTFLVPLLRDQYGVYTPWSESSEDYFLVFAYRDPNIAETFQLYDQLPELIGGMELDQDTLDGYIMNAYSQYAMPQGELSGAISAATDVLEGLEPERTLEYMRQLKQLTPDDVKESARLYAQLSENGARMTAGAASAISANADRFDAILNPFGAVDNTSVELEDVPEGSEHYEAVRFAFENGLMDPLAEDAFGVDEPATHGDLYAAVNVLIGGGKDANEALATLSEYGLANADVDLSAPIAPDDVWILFSGLVGQSVPTLIETADPDAVTRGEFAEMLKAFTEGLE